MTDTPTHAVTLTRVSEGVYQASNGRGAALTVNGDGNFSAVELLLAALAGCTSVDVDVMTGRRAEPEVFEVVASGTKSAEGGNHMTGLQVRFRLRFPEGPDGDKARARIAPAVKASHDRDCTVSRTIELGTPVTFAIETP
ncbi:MAG: OsmC family protein [Propioniciclava sp.]|uniref:OsmC family protein n=1 Tax=Propioniciclava sp. TaxID=2038686 RepID=UPI0039E6E0E6